MSVIDSQVFVAMLDVFNLVRNIFLESAHKYSLINVIFFPEHIQMQGSSQLTSASFIP